MSKPKRRTMRRLKRTLGVTALILALLIALIPNVGEAVVKNTGEFYYEVVNDTFTEDGKTLKLSMDFFGPGASNSISSGHFRLYVTQNAPDTDNDTVIPSWFWNKCYRYQFSLKKFDESKYLNETGGSAPSHSDDPAFYDVGSGSDAFYNNNFDGKFVYRVTFTYEDYFDAYNQHFYPSLYYTTRDGSMANGAVLTVGVDENGYHKNGTKNLTFEATLTDVGPDSDIYVFLNQNVQPDLNIPSGDDHDGNHNAVYFALPDTPGYPQTTDTIYRTSGDSANDVSDGLRSLHLPARTVYLETTTNTSATLANLGIAEDPNHQQDILDAFYTRLSDGTDEMTDQKGRSQLQDHQLYIAFPKDGTSTTFGYSPLISESDKVRVLYKLDGDTSWHDDSGPMEPNYNQDRAWVPFTYQPETTEMAVIIVRASAVVKAADHRGDPYQTVVEANPPYLTNSSDTLDQNLYVDIFRYNDTDVEYTNALTSTGISSDPIWSDTGSWNNDAELVRVIVQKTERATPNIAEASETDPTIFKPITVTLGLRDNPNISVDSARVFVYHKVLSSGNWEAVDPNGRTDFWVDANTNKACVKFDVNTGYDEDYLIYFRSYKGEAMGGGITGLDKRRLDGSTGYLYNGVSASLSGSMTGGTYFLVVEDKKNNLIIPNESDYGSQISGHTDGSYFYNIYIGRQRSGDPSIFDDVSKTVTINGKVIVQMHLPWTVTSTADVLLARAHTDAGGTTTVYWDEDYSVLSGDFIQFEATEFSEYAVFYHDSSDPDDPGSGLEIKDANCFTIEEDNRPEAYTNRYLDKEWDLYLEDPPRNDKDTNYLELEIKNSSSYKTNDGTEFFPFYLELKEINGGVPTTITDIGSDKITVYMPVPASCNYTSGDSVLIVGLNEYNKPANKTTSGVFTKNGGKYLTFEIDSNALQNINPYTIVYTPADGGSGGGGGGGGGGEDDPSSEGIEIDTYDLTDETEKEKLAPGTSASVDLKALGKWSAKTTIPIEENMSLELLVSQYTDPDNSQIGQSIINSSGITAWGSKSSIRAYDIKLKKTVKNKVTWPSTPEDLGKKTVTITLPYQANLANPNGTVSVWTLDKSGSLENLLAATTASEGGNVTFDAEHFSQFAILYNPGSASPSGGASTSSGGSTSSATGGSSNSSSASNSASSGRSSSSSSSASSGASNSSNSGTSSSSNTGSGSGGGGNRASGDGKVDMPHTADATTYKAIFILILLAFGAFELVSSMPAKKKAKAKASSSEKPADTSVHEERIHF